MQGRKTAVLNLYDLLNAFMEKLVLWRVHIMNNKFVMFSRFTSINSSKGLINIASDVTNHLCNLEKLRYYFADP